MSDNNEPEATIESMNMIVEQIKDLLRQHTKHVYLQGKLDAFEEVKELNSYEKEIGS